MALEAGHPPLSALQLALDQARPAQLLLIKRTFALVQPVLELPGLSFRQKQALIAVRYAKTASLSHLSRVLNWDRSNTCKRLSILVKKGHVFKFYGEQGPYYMSIDKPLPRHFKSSVVQLILDHLQQLEEEAGPAKTETPPKPTTPTTVTTLTTNTIPTNNAIPMRPGDSSGVSPP